MFVKQVSPPLGGRHFVGNNVAMDGVSLNDLSECHKVDVTLPVGWPCSSRFVTICTKGESDSPLFVRVCLSSVLNCSVKETYSDLFRSWFRKTSNWYFRNA